MCVASEEVERGRKFRHLLVRSLPRSHGRWRREAEAARLAAFRDPRIKFVSQRDWREIATSQFELAVIITLAFLYFISTSVPSRSDHRINNANLWRGGSHNTIVLITLHASGDFGQVEVVHRLQELSRPGNNASLID